MIHRRAHGIERRYDELGIREDDDYEMLSDSSKYDDYEEDEYM